MQIATERRGRALVCRVAGELDLSTAGNLREAVDGAMARYDLRDLVLDLSELDFVDSSGVGAILGRYRHTAELGGRMALVSPPQRLRPVLEMAGILQLMPEGATVAEAASMVAGVQS